MKVLSHVDHDGRVSRVHVHLSRTNLRALLHKLDVPTSARTIYKQLGEARLIVTAEEDDAHYEAFGGQRGIMAQETEDFLAQEDQT